MWGRTWNLVQTAAGAWSAPWCATKLMEYELTLAAQLIDQLPLVVRDKITRVEWRHDRQRWLCERHQDGWRARLIADDDVVIGGGTVLDFELVITLFDSARFQRAAAGCDSIERCHAEIIVNPHLTCTLYQRGKVRRRAFWQDRAARLGEMLRGYFTRSD